MRSESKASNATLRVNFLWQKAYGLCALDFLL